MPASFTCYQAVTNINQGLQIEIVISDSAKPPTRRDDSVKTLCIITILLDPPIWYALPKEVSGDGKSFRRIKYDLRMISDGSSLEFAVWHKGQCLASQAVGFESEEKEEAHEDAGDVQMQDQPDAASDLHSVIEEIIQDNDTDEDYVDVPDGEDDISMGRSSMTVRTRRGSWDDEFCSP